MTRLLLRRLVLPAALSLTGLWLAVGTVRAEVIECTGSSQIGPWSYSYGADTAHLDLVEINQTALKYALVAAEKYEDPSRTYGRVQLRLVGEGRELLVKLPAVIHRGHSYDFELFVKDWKGFKLVLLIDGKEASRAPFKYDAYTAMSYQPADSIVEALRSGTDALFSLLDNGDDKVVVTMEVPLKGFGEAVDASRVAKAALAAKVAAGDTCRESSLLDWE